MELWEVTGRGGKFDELGLKILLVLQEGRAFNPVCNGISVLGLHLWCDIKNINPGRDHFTDPR